MEEDKDTEWELIIFGFSYIFFLSYLSHGVSVDDIMLEWKSKKIKYIKSCISLLSAFINYRILFSVLISYVVGKENNDNMRWKKNPMNYITLWRRLGFFFLVILFSSLSQHNNIRNWGNKIKKWYPL